MTKRAEVAAAADLGARRAEAIEQVAVGALTPYAANARTHGPAQVAQIAASIRAYGFTNPVLIDAEGTIIAGHGRVLAAQHLGLATVPCVRLGYLTPAQRRAYVLADNRLAELAGWDEAVLAAEVAALVEAADAGVDLAALGWAEAEIQRLVAQAAAAAALQPTPEGSTNGQPVVGGVGDVFSVSPIAPPVLKDGDRAPYQQMTFTLHDEQVIIVTAALERAKAAGATSDLNANSNGNALAAICEVYGG